MTIIRVIDLETTGVEADDEPVEIAIIDCNVQDGGRLWETSLIKPKKSIPPTASAVHHLTDGDVAEAITWKEFFQRSAIWNNVVDYYAAHNADFEQRWIHGPTLWICTWKCALRVWPHAPGHSNQVLRYWLNPPGLDRELATPPHRAGPDAYVTAHLLALMLKLEKVESLAEWSKMPALLVNVNFGKYRGKKWSELPDDYLRWLLGQDFGHAEKYTAGYHLNRRQQTGFDIEDQGS